ncbi:MAG: hypothetical protein WC758_07450 [Candidatus Woesearchaeota archaeon]
MGGYLLFNVEFPSKEDRDKFEKLFKIKRMFQYKDIEYDCFYYPRWMGYGDPKEMIMKMRKEKIKFKKFLSNDLPCNSSWFDEIKEKSYEE